MNGLYGSRLITYNTKKREGDFDSAYWRMKHTRLITNLREQLNTANCAVFMEKQNSFRLQVD